MPEISRAPSGELYVLARGRHASCFVHCMKPSAPSTPEQSHRHFFELIKEFDTATLVTRNRSNELHGRPLSLARTEDGGTLWFSTSLQSVKVEEISADSRVLVVMQNSNQFIVSQGF